MLNCNRYGTHIKFIKLYNFDTMQADSGVFKHFKSRENHVSCRDLQSYNSPDD